MTIFAIIAAVLTVLLGVHMMFALTALAVAVGCFLVVRKIRRTGWVIPRAAT